MDLALDAATSARLHARPNPWVGAAVLVDGDVGAHRFSGSTRPPGGAHAEIEAIRAAAEALGADRLRGATLATTLEPCSHHGRTGPCAEAIVDAGISRVLVGVEDPDPKVAGRGIARLRAAGIEVVTGVRAAEVAEQLAPYLHHRRTGRPYVVLKLAATLDGRTAAPDGSSQWITSAEARRDVHLLRAQSDAIVVGSGTVRADDPTLTVRHVDGPSPRRVVLGSAPAGALVHPCLEFRGDPADLLARLGAEDVIQLLVEGGATVAAQWHREGLIDRYVLYLAPALMGGDDGTPLLRGVGAATLGEMWRGHIVSTRIIGGDIRVDLVRNPPTKEQVSAELAST